MNAGWLDGWTCFFMDTSAAGRMEETNMTNMPNNVALMSSARGGQSVPAAINPAGSRLPCGSRALTAIWRAMKAAGSKL